MEESPVGNLCCLHTGQNILQLIQLANDLVRRFNLIILGFRLLQFHFNLLKMNIVRTQSLTSLASRLSNSSLITLPTYEYEILQESDENLESKSILIFNVHGEDVKLELPKRIGKKKKHWYTSRYKKSYKRKKKDSLFQSERFKESKLRRLKNCLICKPISSKRPGSSKCVPTDCTWKKIKASWCSFWSKLWNRIWNLHIEAFIIPPYRKEWGFYADWSYKYMKLPVEDPIQERKREHRMKLKEKYDKFFHDHKDCQIIRINVSGKIYCTQRKVLENYPDTLLGNPHRRVRYYDPCRNEYFFDRHRNCFEPILHYYQSGGGLYRPKDISVDTFIDELKFYGFGDHVIERFFSQEGVERDQPQTLPVSLYKRKVWCLMEYPDSSNIAKFISIVSIFAIIFSTGVFCIDTMPIFEDALNTHLHGMQDAFTIADLVCLQWFALEYILRFLFCPNKWTFFWKPSNLIDLIAVIPYIISTIFRITESAPKYEEGEPKVKLQHYLLRYAGMTRVLRVLKISRYSKGLQVLGKTLTASVNELSVLLIFLSIGVIILSSAIYFAEYNEAKSEFYSIPDAFWWGVQVLTTLGIGDKVPYGTIGRIIASIAAISGVLIIAFPVPVIATKFNLFYSREISSQQRINTGKSIHITQCPNLPSCPMIETQVIQLLQKLGDQGKGVTLFKAKDKNKPTVATADPESEHQHHHHRKSKDLNHKEKRFFRIAPTMVPRFHKKDKEPKVKIEVEAKKAMTVIQFQDKESPTASSSSDDQWFDAEE